MIQRRFSNWTKVAGEGSNVPRYLSIIPGACLQVYSQ